MRLRVTLAFLLAALAPGQAVAAGAVVGQAGETVVLSWSRVAVAVAPGRTTLWAQVSVSGASTGFVWIVPVRPGARVDPGSDAWLDALDAATSPVVLPPVDPPGPQCDAGRAPAIATPGTSSQATRRAATGIFSDEATLAAFVHGAGYALPQDVASALATLFASGASVVASTYGSAWAPTHTLRIVDGGPPVLPLALTGASASGAPVTAFVVAPAAATAGTSPISLDPGSLLWGGPDTLAYASKIDRLVAQSKGAHWVTESALPDLLFDGVPLGSHGALPAVVGNYFQLAGAYGDAVGDPSACASAAYATRNEAAPYAALCPDGALGVVPGPGPCGSAGDGGEEGGVPIDTLACGGANDAALALASLAATDVWITRIEGWVTPTSAGDVAVSIAPTAPASPVVTATGYVPSCEVQDAAPPWRWTPGAPPPMVGSPPVGDPLSTPPPPSPPLEPVGGYGPPPPPSADVGAAAEGCGAVADACASSNDSSSDGSGGCGSSNPPDDGGTDPSSSDSSGGCSSSSSSDGSSSSTCTTARGKRSRGRSPVSRVLVALAAACAIARRRQRAAS